MECPLSLWNRKEEAGKDGAFKLVLLPLPLVHYWYSWHGLKLGAFRMAGLSYDELSLLCESKAVTCFCQAFHGRQDWPYIRCCGFLYIRFGLDATV